MFRITEIALTIGIQSACMHKITLLVYSVQRLMAPFYCFDEKVNALRIFLKCELSEKFNLVSYKFPFFNHYALLRWRRRLQNALLTCTAEDDF